MPDWVKLAIKIVATALIVLNFPYMAVLLLLVLGMSGIWWVTIGFSMLIPLLTIPMLWLKKRKKYGLFLLGYLLCFVILLGTQLGINAYEASVTIDVTPAIKVEEYLPFEADSKIVKVKSQDLDFSGQDKNQLPVLDGAAAVFPVYSAFVHAVYPANTQLYHGVFEYNNTVAGYEMLAHKETDIFFGAYPSEEQIEYAATLGTSFEYTQIGSEAFVFFVHRDNPVESLTLQQIKDIYSGKITNWKEVGGYDEEIVPFQRNPGSGSQSMLIRLMGDTPILEPEIKEQIGGMGEIIQKVADYKNRTSSIGFSFRFYVEGIIKNPDIKMIAIDGIAPTKENIRSGAYPVVTPLYAVTWKGNNKETVALLLEWILSEEGQYIIEQTGYVGIGN